VAPHPISGPADSRVSGSFRAKLRKTPARYRAGVFCRKLPWGLSLSYSSFHPSRTPWASSRLRNQLHRLFSTTIRCSWETGDWIGREDGRDFLSPVSCAGVGYTIAHKHQLWWSPRDPEQRPLWNSVVILSAELYDDGLIGGLDPEGSTICSHNGAQKEPNRRDLEPRSARVQSLQPTEKKPLTERAGPSNSENWNDDSCQHWCPQRERSGTPFSPNSNPLTL
jgi:hypothetical protein